MWSIGCITVVLLTGGSPFRDPSTNQYSQVMARQCNLTDLEQNDEWKAVAERPKDFVKKLLRLAETERLTAKQALCHEWFTHETYQDEFRKLYDRSTRYWKTRPVKPPLIEDIDGNSIKVRRSHLPSSEPRFPRRKISQPMDPPYVPYPRKLNSLVSPRDKRRPLYARSDVIDAVENIWKSTISERPTRSSSHHRCESDEITLPNPSWNAVPSMNLQQPTNSSIEKRTRSILSWAFIRHKISNLTSKSPLEEYDKDKITGETSLQMDSPETPRARTSAVFFPQAQPSTPQSQESQIRRRRRPFSPDAWSSKSPRQSSRDQIQYSIPILLGRQKDTAPPKGPNIPEAQNLSVAPVTANTSRIRVPSSNHKRKNPLCSSRRFLFSQTKPAASQGQKRSIYELESGKDAIVEGIGGVSHSDKRFRGQ